ncbi:hypothetical protein KTS45_05000 [Halomicroarcula limicola]|uniref:Sodium/calcium exchanger membrane region domain-containing protein n=1 Tax=Haloarcula limicola TaxID=1429915 RepID=A0A8J7Y3J1_9EURY|nr:sodium:calcium antiporter [Halomicroarcula limicola]MBV0923552.1 hypothetical protein [Halomicroarcula limicola]
MVALDTATILELAAGTVALVTLVKGAGTAVARSLALARHFDVSEDLVGMFVLSIGTSLPEIGTHLVASVGILGGRLEYVVASGTVIGANMGASTAQQLFLMGVLFVGYGRYRPTKSFLRSSYLPMLGAFVLLLALGVDGTISRLDGAVLLLAFAGYAYRRFSEPVDRAVLAEVPQESTRVGRDAAVAAGALLLVLASAFVVLSVVEATVDRLRLSGSMLGVVTVGIAAALPELTTVIESIRRRTPALALGTLVGSNVVNPLIGIGLGGVVSTYAVPPSVILWDLPFKLAVGAGLFAYLRFVGDGSLGRREGGTMLVLYLGYVIGRLVLFPG